MKVKLLKKARKAIQLVNYHGMPAKSTDKLISIQRKNVDGTISTLKTSKNKIAYINYGNALIRRRAEILDVARDLEVQSKLWHVFH